MSSLASMTENEAFKKPFNSLQFHLSKQSIIRVVFHDRRLQYTEHQQLECWRWSRPGDRILDIGENLSLRYPYKCELC